ncbi:MAG: DUF2189 domain-containing protein [Alphaproteobacteria bacterium]|nr:DUF2189 domain-containing protein [Alphaproteobacteria bacterium]
MAHIKNPLEWTAAEFGSAAGHVRGATRSVYGSEAPPTLRRIAVGDLRDALRRGFDDFAACRTDVIFLCLIYPLAGLVLARFALNQAFLPLLFPLASGFALLGPVAAVGLYEMSREREQGVRVSWAHAFGVTRAPSFGAIVVLSLILLALFLAWLGAAVVLYALTLGPEAPASLSAFATDVFTTPAGWAMIGIGVAVGFVFAVVALAISVVSYPILLDHDVGLATAIGTSVRAVRQNPRTMAVWGLIVAGGLVLGTIPAFVGLIVVLPVLGHATWHLYRKLVA